MISGNDFTDAQKQKVNEWAAEGLSLGEIQDCLAKEFDLKITYMNMHLLMLDLGVTLKADEPEPEPEPEPVPEVPAAPEAAAAEAQPAAEPAAPASTPDAPDAEPVAEEPFVQVEVSDVAVPGTMASGSVTFSDGEGGTWFVNTEGRLSLDPKTPGYEPDEANVMAFQQELQRLARGRGL